MGPLISVIVPVYNVERYLSDCVESILAQTYRNIELLLVDDGSPDNCPELCDDYAKQDSRVRVLHKRNGGLSSARNVGLDAAHGEYIGFVDSDDSIEPDMYEKLLCALERDNADVSICNLIQVDEENHPITSENVTPIQAGIYTGKEALQSAVSLANGWIFVTAWNKLYKREIFKSLRFPEGKLHEDEAIIHKVFLNCERVSVLENVLYNYRIRKDSIITAYYNVKRMDGAEVMLQRGMDCLDIMDEFWHFKNVGGVAYSLNKGYKHRSNPEVRKRWRLIKAQYLRFLQELSEQKKLSLFHRVLRWIQVQFPVIWDMLCLIAQKILKSLN